MPAQQLWFRSNGQAMGAIVNIVTARWHTNQFQRTVGLLLSVEMTRLNATDYFNNLNGGEKRCPPPQRLWLQTSAAPIMKGQAVLLFLRGNGHREKRGKLRRRGTCRTALEKKTGDFSELRPRPCENVPGLDTNKDGNKRYFLYGPVPEDQRSNTGLTARLKIFPRSKYGPAPVNCNNWNVLPWLLPSTGRQESVRGRLQNWKGRGSLFGRFTPGSLVSAGSQQPWDFGEMTGTHPWKSNWIQPGYQATVKLTKLIGSLRP